MMIFRYISSSDAGFSNACLSGVATLIRGGGGVGQTHHHHHHQDYAGTLNGPMEEKMVRVELSMPVSPVVRVQCEKNTTYLVGAWAHSAQKKMDEGFFSRIFHFSYSSAAVCRLLGSEL